MKISEDKEEELVFYPKEFAPFGGTCFSACLLEGARASGHRLQRGAAGTVETVAAAACSTQTGLLHTLTPT